MKTIKKIYDKICSVENVTDAIKRASAGKRSRVEVQRVLADVPAHAKAIADMLANQNYTPCKYVEKTIKEGSNGKERKIAKIAFYPDQIIHWAIILQLQPTLLKSSYRYSCGCMPGRGIHFGKKIIEEWLERDRKNTKYIAKLDIRKFYPSINRDSMKQVFRRVTSDKRLLTILDAIVDSYSPGLPIGYLTSQWFSNLLLQRLDYIIKQHLRIKYYIRYMDDMVLFGSSKKKLRVAVDAIKNYLNGIELELKKNWQIFPIQARSLDFMGFRFFREKTILRKSLLYRITRTAASISRQSRVDSGSAAAMISYMGWIRRSKSHNVYMKRIRPVVSISGLKRIISLASKNRRIVNEDNTGKQRLSTAGTRQNK